MLLFQFSLQTDSCLFPCCSLYSLSLFCYDLLFSLFFLGFLLLLFSCSLPSSCSLSIVACWEACLFSALSYFCSAAKIFISPNQLANKNMYFCQCISFSAIKRRFNKRWLVSTINNLVKYNICKELLPTQNLCIVQQPNLSCSMLGNILLAY